MKIRPLPALLTLALFVAACASSAPPPPANPAPSPITPAPRPAAAAPPLPTAAELEAAIDAARPEDSLPVDPVVRKGVLANGLTYLVRRHPTPEQRAEVWLVINAGSLQEDEDQQGLAHFIEHMAFNGTRRFARQAMVDYLESVGLRFGPDLNAYTSFDETVYMLRVPTDRPQILERALDLYEDWLTGGMSLEGGEIDKERGVIVEEWREGRGAQARLVDRQIPTLLAGSRYADRLVIGTMETLREAPHEALRRFYRDWYRPDLAALIAVGDFDPAEMESRIRARFEKIPRREDPRPRLAYEVPGHRETLFSIEEDPELTDTRIAVYYKHPAKPEGSYGDYRRMLTETIYDSLMNARLDELAQAQDPPFLGAAAASDGLVRTASAYYQIAGVAAGGVERGLAALLKEAERVDRFGFTATELERVKAEIARSYEGASKERDTIESRGLAAEYVRHFLTGEPIPGIAMEAALVRHFLPRVSLDELNRLARDWITEENRVILASGPKAPGVSLPSREALLAVFDRVRAETLVAYVDQVVDAPLLAEKPTPGTVVSESTIPEIGVIEWRLTNGARVVLKPTTFKNDEVLLSAFSPGGSSLISDRDYNSAIFAPSLLGESGIGGFSSVELAKALAGKRAAVRPYISDLEEGFSGGASPADLETMLQLLYLQFTSPRLDPQAAKTFLDKLTEVVRHRADSPETAFTDRLHAAMWKNHPRRQPVTPEVLAAIDVEQALASYRERFADASDFTFLLVGNLDLAAVKPLVETYIGSLPSIARRETYRDIGVQSPSGVVEVRVAKGIEAKSQVVIHWGGDAEWTRENAHGLETLADALSIRLREVLREDRGATYGVNVAASLTARPRPLYDLTIEFGCAPENADALVAGVFDEIKSLRKRGVPPAVTQKIQETQRRANEVALNENDEWLGRLEAAYTLGFDPRQILDRDRLIRRINPALIRDTARRYLTLDRYVLGVLSPESTGGNS